VIEAVALITASNGTEDFFLLQLRLRRNVGNHRGLDEVAFPASVSAFAAGEEASVFLALLDVFENRIHRAFVDDRAHGGVFGDVADVNFFDARFQLFEEFIVDALVDNGARAGGTLLSLKSERRLCHAFDRGVDVGVGVDDDGVFAAHLKNRALDPDLAGSLRGRDFVDVQANFARTGESDVARLGMRDHRVAEARSGARDRSSPRPRACHLFQQFEKPCAMVGESLDGFRITVLPLTIEASVIPAMMAQGKFHGGITAPTPSGMYISVSCSPGNCMGVCAFAKRNASRA
jgi:hypothetical protein